MRADADLPWYFNTGAKTRIGDAGLRSTLGAQVAHLQAAQLSEASSRARAAAMSASWRRVDDPRWERDQWQARPKAQAAVDVSEIEDDMIDRIGMPGPNPAEVAERLGGLSVLHVRVLHLHYSGESLPHEVDPAAIVLEAARRACRTRTEPTVDALRVALMKPGRVGVIDLVTMAADARAVVLAAQLAYEVAPFTPVRRVQVDDPREGRRV